jgi:hypothetical protein
LLDYRDSMFTAARLYYATQPEFGDCSAKDILMRAYSLLRTALCVGLLLSLALATAPAARAFPTDVSFGSIWASTDQAVASGSASYSWFWGPELRDQRVEAYLESPGAYRDVRYYDKSRMEINDPDNSPATPYYVTNGLLTEELVTGNMQIGDATFQQRPPSTQLVAGDPADNPGTPSYATFAPYATTDGVSHRAEMGEGAPVGVLMSSDGQLNAAPNYGVSLTQYQEMTGHSFANVFWDWANDPASGFNAEQGVDWLYVLGYPISEPYWIDSTVGGTQRRVLVQLFERRVLTYTPDNPAAFQVEFGNIGLHYHAWRYGSSPIDERATNITGAPATDGAHVVWAADNADTHNDIYSEELGSSGAPPVIHSALDEYAPDVDGARLVWTQHDDSCYSCGDIMYADITTGAPQVVAATSADEEAPSVSGDWVTWIAFDPTGINPAQLLARDVTTDVAPLTLFEAYDSVYAPAIATPQIDGERVAWLTYHVVSEHTATWQLLTMKLSDIGPTPVADGSLDIGGPGAVLGGFNRPSFALAGDTLAWSADLSAHVVDLTTGTRTDITGAGDTPFTPLQGVATDGRYVVWQDYRWAADATELAMHWQDPALRSDIWGYDLQTGHAFSVTLNTGYNSGLRVADGVLAWTQGPFMGPSNLETVSLAQFSSP